MLRNKVNSRNLAEVGWLDGKLEILFQNGAIYQYSSIPRDVYDTMMLAPSPGQFFSANIRNKYPTKMLTDGKEQIR